MTTLLQRAKANMINGQILPNQVTDAAIIDAIRTIPKEKFIPESFASLAYTDNAIPIMNHRYIVKPLVLAQLLQAAEIAADDIVLNIGCATGYTTAVLAAIAYTVTAIESDAELASTASSLLDALDIPNASVIGGALEEGYDAGKPYDVILIEGTIRHIPSALVAQLKEGGRLVAIMPNASGMTSLIRATRKGEHLVTQEITHATAPIFPSFDIHDTTHTLEG